MTSATGASGALVLALLPHPVNGATMHASARSGPTGANDAGRNKRETRDTGVQIMIVQLEAPVTETKLPSGTVVVTVRPA